MFHNLLTRNDMLSIISHLSENFQDQSFIDGALCHMLLSSHYSSKERDFWHEEQGLTGGEGVNSWELIFLPLHTVFWFLSHNFQQRFGRQRTFYWGDLGEGNRMKGKS